MTWNYN